MFADTSLQSSATLWQWHSPVCLASLSFIFFFLFFCHSADDKMTRNSSKTMAHLCLSSPKANDLQISSTSRQVRVRICKSSHSARRFVLVKVLVKDVSCWLPISEPLSSTQNLPSCSCQAGNMGHWRNHFLPTLSKEPTRKMDHRIS